MVGWLSDSLNILIALALVGLNGFFVAAEFALVKVRGTQIERLVRQNRPFARTARWLVRRMDRSLSVCQLGITMASLGLGWVGEPAFARLLEPLARRFGVTSDAALHTIGFAVAFSTITALHLVIGEQGPKIFAIRRPERVIVWCAAPLKAFYLLTFPLTVGLDGVTSLLLRAVGVKGASGHDAPHSEEEIRALLSQSLAQGSLTRSEHQLLHAVFEFDDTIARRVMVPRSDVVFLDVNRPVQELLELARRTKHTRYPLCDGSLDQVLGIVHIKDLVGRDPETIDLRQLMRPAKQVPETMLISRLLRRFQATHQLMATVVDEHGTTVGIVTLENVLETIVGLVDDEFDVEAEPIVHEGGSTYTVLGGTSLEVLRQRFNLELDTMEVETLSGLLMERLGRVPQVGDNVELEGATAAVLETRGARATRVRLAVLPRDAPSD